MISLENKIFGRLKVVKRSDYIHPTKGRVYWDCVCSCGNLVTVRGDGLTKGDTLSCGCYHKDKVSSITKRKSLEGKRFYRLLVINYSYTNKNNQAVWLCRCDCGNTKEISSGSLLSGRTRTCGCRGLDEQGSTLNSTYRQYVTGAKNRNLEFFLTKEEFKVITKENCYYCGISPNNIRKTKHKENYVYNGIDRIDNSKGYVKGNVVPCCSKCNKAKNKYSKDDFLSWVRSVFIHSIQMNQEV